jgi:hypothetical protein
MSEDEVKSTMLSKFDFLPGVLNSEVINPPKKKIKPVGKKTKTKLFDILKNLDRENN